MRCGNCTISNPIFRTISNLVVFFRGRHYNIGCALGINRKQEKKLHKVKNLAMLWARAADWYLGSIEHVNEGLRDEFERWFYFAISCPVDGGRAFDSIRNALRARNYTLAAHLISVVA
uniref:Transposase n=1 Tax=Haemonchus contortus TaxID=6289 RepID=A0A7I4YTS1_HAECO